VSPRSRSEWRPARAFRKIRAYSTRRTSTATGVVLVLATIAALGAAALDPTLTGTGYLTAVANHPNRLAVSALLYLVAAGTSVGIAIALYPLLRKLNAGLALGAVVFRAIEAVLYTTAVVSLLSLMPLAQHFAAGAQATVLRRSRQLRTHSSASATMPLWQRSLPSTWAL
jgi:hypothetical protein